MDDHFCLAEVALFQDLSRSEMARIAARAPLRTVRAGQPVFDPARPVTVLFIVKSGRVRIYRPLPDGRTVTTAMPGPGSIFGEMPLLGLRMRASRAEALTDAQLCLMSRSDVQRLMLDDPRIAVRIVEHLGARIGELEQRLADLSGATVVQRIAHTLGALTAPAPGDVGGRGPDPVRLTHAQLAGLVGATRERTTVALGELAGRGLVRLHRGRIRVVDAPGLAALADAGRAEPPAGRRGPGRHHRESPESGQPWGGGVGGTSISLPT